MLPESIGELKQLQELNLWHCESLIRLPEQISQLPQLQELHLRNCNNLVALPQNIGTLPKLQILDLVGCDNLSRLPESIKKSPKLQILGWENQTDEPVYPYQQIIDILQNIDPDELSAKNALALVYRLKEML